MEDEPDGMLAYALAIQNPDRNDPNWPLPSFDARDWAKSFCEIAAKNGHPGIDEGWMISWFANALMRGFDEANMRNAPSFKALWAFALEKLRDGVFGLDDEAIVALADRPQPTLWKAWEETPTEEGQWFWWRDPNKPDELHADQAEPDAKGFIEMKHGCGLDYYPECQPLSMADDVKDVIEQSYKSRREFEERQARDWKARQDNNRR